MTEKQFLKYFIVDVGRSIGQYEESIDQYRQKLSEMSAVPTPTLLSDEPRRPILEKPKEFEISVMKCQPSSKRYCE